MSARDRIGGGDGIEVVDVNGSFARFLKNAPKECRERVSAAVLVTAHKLAQRMGSVAPVGPDAPHIANTVTFKHRGLTATVGYLAEDFGGDEAGDGSTATIAEVALYNEYRPNQQPFMRPSAEAESSDFVRRMAAAVASMERALGNGI